MWAPGTGPGGWGGQWVRPPAVPAVRRYLRRPHARARREMVRRALGLPQVPPPGPGRPELEPPPVSPRPPSPGGRLLDVGCGSGRFLARAASLGYTVTGCDFNPVAVRTARERYGLSDVHHASLEEFRLRQPERRFDVVTAFEVLEHTDDPAGFLAQIVDLLDAGGMVAVSVPFRDRWPRFGVDSPWDLPPHHLTRWSKRAIHEALRRAGLDTVELRTGWMIGEELWLKYVRFGMVDRLFRKAAENGTDPHEVARFAPLASRLLRAKRAVAKVGGAPINAVLRILGATGMDMYALARRR